MINDIKKQVSLCTFIIVVANVLCFILTEIFGPASDTSFLYDHGALVWLEILVEGEYYRLFTYMFLHGSLAHIVNNMIVLVFVGSGLERTIGKIKFLLIYFVSGIGAGLASALFSQAEYNSLLLTDKVHYAVPVGVGASGAVFGIVGAMIYVVIRNKGRVENISRQQLLIFVVLSLYGGFTSTGIDNVAHIGGVIIGFVVAVILYHGKKQREMGGTIQ